MHQAPTARSEFLAGVRAFLPLLMANAPFAMVCGAAAISAGLSPWQAFGMSWIIFAGSAQIAVTQLLASGAPFLTIVGTALIINLRFMMYSASLGPYVSSLPRRWKILLAYLITDQAYAIAILRFLEPGEQKHRHWFLFGISGATWFFWQIATILGIFVGSLIPADWSIDFVLPLTFIALVVPLLSSPAMLCAAIVGGGGSVLLVLPLKLNLIAATLLGIASGMTLENFLHRAPCPPK